MLVERRPAKNSRSVLPSGETTRSGRWFRLFQPAWIVTGSADEGARGRDRRVDEVLAAQRCPTGRCQTTWRTRSEVRSKSPGSAKLTLLVGVIRVHLPGGPAGPEEAVAGVDKKRDKRNERQ